MATRTLPDDQAVPAFVIKELTGRRRKITLTERALPHRPFTLEGTQQIEVTNYPGNPVATSTVLGSREGSTSISGYWKDKFIQNSVRVEVTGASTPRPAPARANNTSVANVEMLVDLIDDVRASGSLLEVAWGSRIRRGHLTKLTQTWNNVNDCEWSMEFQWISRGQPRVTPLVQDADASTMAQRTTRNWWDLERALEDVPTNPTGDWRDTLIDSVGLIGSYATQFEDMVAQTYATAVQPLDAVRAGLSNLTGVISAGTTVLETLMEVPPERMFFFVAGSDLGVPSFYNALLATEYAFQVRAAAAKTVSEAALDRDTLLRLAANDVEQIYTATANDDLIMVSQKFYNTPDQWRALMLFNELRTPQLTTGQIVLIPRLSSGES